MTGYYEHDELGYAGKVGTGYDDVLLKDLRKRLDQNAKNVHRERVAEG